jgi:hypothetical protein
MKSYYNRQGFLTEVSKKAHKDLSTIFSKHSTEKTLLQTNGNPSMSYLFCGAQR